MAAEDEWTIPVSGFHAAMREAEAVCIEKLAAKDAEIARLKGVADEQHSQLMKALVRVDLLEEHVRALRAAISTTSCFWTTAGSTATEWDAAAYATRSSGT